MYGGCYVESVYISREIWKSEKVSVPLPLSRRGSKAGGAPCERYRDVYTRDWPAIVPAIFIYTEIETIPNNYLMLN